MVVFVYVASVERIIYATFRRFNQQWRNRTLPFFTSSLTSPLSRVRNTYLTSAIK